MNEIRKNDEQEIELLKANFKVPSFLVVLLIILMIVFGLICYLLMHFFDEIGIVAFSIGLFLVIIIGFIVSCINISKCSLTITNKRIYGLYYLTFIKKEFNYRIDEINNVEVITVFGVHGLAINFTQGNYTSPIVNYGGGVTPMRASGTFKVQYIANINEVYDKLTELITAVKNDKDVYADIEMNKIDVENRKVTAFEKIAANINDGSYLKMNSELSYIDELKKLKELLDSGIITEEEFEQKKKKLLS